MVDPPPQTLEEDNAALSPVVEVFEGIPVVNDDQELLRRGICRAKISESIDIDRWADELSQVTPLIMAFEGDGEYAFYRNILEEPEFPFDKILFAETPSEASEIGTAILKHFPVLPEKPSMETELLSKELRLDDAFCVHYNMDQDDTSGAKHMDPSDITINMCLQKSQDTRGSYVLFHGTKHLQGLDSAEEQSTTTPKEDQFLVPQIPGTATIHFGDHFHETTHLREGLRTNIILTYLYIDTTRSDASTRSCY